MSEILGPDCFSLIRFRSGRHAQRGAALLEATIATALLAMVAAAAFTAFSHAGRGAGDAARSLAALALAESTLDAHLHAGFLAEAAAAAQRRDGLDGGLRWRLTAAPWPEPDPASQERAMLVRVDVAVDAAGDRGAAPLAALTTLRAVR